MKSLKLFLALFAFLIGGLVNTYAEQSPPDVQNLEIVSTQLTDATLDVDYNVIDMQRDVVIYINETGELSGKVFANQLLEIEPVQTFNLPCEYSYRYSDNCLIRLCSDTANINQISYKKTANSGPGIDINEGLIRKSKFLILPVKNLNYKYNQNRFS